MTGVIDFREYLADLQRAHARAVARFVSDSNMFHSGRTMSAVSYRNLAVEVANSARAVVEATEEIVEWMRYHEDVRDADGLPPLTQRG